MPYINEQIRKQLHDGFLDDLRQSFLNIDENNRKGTLSYIITKLCDDYISSSGLRYNNLVNIVGVLELTKQEFVRRLVNQYEDIKIEENGDVFTAR